MSPTSEFIKYPAFESGVVKIQRGNHQDLTEAEKIAVQILRNEGAAIDESEICTGPTGMAERMSKCRRTLKDNKND